MTSTDKLVNKYLYDGRFVLTLGCGIVCTLLVACGKITGEVFQWTVLGTVGAYIAGNVAQEFKGGKNANTPLD